jgi:hypothetical protein
MFRIRTLLWSVPVALLVFHSQICGQTAGYNGYAGNNGGYLWGQPLPTSFQQQNQAPAGGAPADLSGLGSEGIFCPTPYCLTPCCPAWQVVGDFLYLRPGRDAVAVAVPINGAIVPPPGVAPVQVGNTMLADVSFQPGFRVGLARWLDTCSAVEATYTRFEGRTSATVESTAPIVLRSLVAHPGTFDAPTDFLAASADYGIQFQIADVDYRGVLHRGDCWVVTYLLGARYAHLWQGFDSTFANSTLTETVDTRLRFDGGGIRLGLDGERRFGCSGFSIYGSGMASFLGGTYRGRFVEQQTPGSETPLVLTGWKDDRVVPILDLELGLGWMSEGGGVRLKAGYMFSGWFNTPTTDAFIHSVQTGQAGKLNDTLTFDGLNARIEFVF